GIDGLPRGVVFALALAGSTVVGAAQGAGGGLELTFLYLLAVAFAAWFLGRASGLAVAVASAVSWLAADRLVGADQPAGPRAVSVALQLAAFGTAALVVAALRARRRRESGLARTDGLTGLLNRRGFLESARREIARSARTSRPLTIARLDVDGFRAINDGHGQETGDRMLAGLGAALRAGVRVVDACARIGGDEFAVLLTETDAFSADALLDRLRSVAAQSAIEAGAPVTLTVGAVTFERPPASVDEMLQAADRLLREAKSAGGNVVRHERAA
ncbi:MAG TPA: GGDEF domain-containing protein, partial [Vicinamibacteria bacterium]|nr:GGDEF domain-containing protein [Vicinamibacteria bacterium]